MEYVWVCLGGIGVVKFGGNYVVLLLVQVEVVENGCDQVVWLDVVECCYIEEMGGMNIFFVFGSGGLVWLVILELFGFLLFGIIWDLLLQLVIDVGFVVEECRIDIDEWQKKVVVGEIIEVFVCGIVVVIILVVWVWYGVSEFRIVDGQLGEVIMVLCDMLIGIQWGIFVDIYGWMVWLGQCGSGFVGCWMVGCVVIVWLVQGWCGLVIVLYVL